MWLSLPASQPLPGCWEGPSEVPAALRAGDYCKDGCVVRSSSRFQGAPAREASSQMSGLPPATQLAKTEALWDTHCLVGPALFPPAPRSGKGKGVEAEGWALMFPGPAE